MRGQCTSCYAKENVGVDILIKMMNELERIVVLRGFFILKKKDCIGEKNTFMVGVCLGLHLRTDIEKMKMCLTR